MRTKAGSKIQILIKAVERIRIELTFSSVAAPCVTISPNGPAFVETITGHNP